jgi:hypothetical protein
LEALSLAPVKLQTLWMCDRVQERSDP